MLQKIRHIGTVFCQLRVNAENQVVCFTTPQYSNCLKVIEDVLRREAGVPHLANIRTGADFKEARGRGLDDAIGKDYRDKARTAFHSQTSSASMVQAFSRFLTRFRDGSTPAQEVHGSQ